MFWGVRLKSFWIFGLFAAVGFLGAGFLYLSKGSKTPVNLDLLGRQAVIAKADAGNIEAFFQTIGNSVALVAQLRSMELGDKSTTDNLDRFVDQWRDSNLVSGIVFINNKGVVTFHSNTEDTHDVGVSVSDRQYFAWAKNQEKEGGYYVGRPIVSRIGASKDQIIVTVASPVFANEVFFGVVAAAIKLQPLAQRNLELIKVSENTYMYLLDKNGELFYSSPGSEELGDYLKGLLSANSQGQIQQNDRLIGYVPIELGSQDWVLIISSRYQDISSFNVPFYVRQSAALFLVSLTTLVIGILVSRKSQKRL